MLRTELMLLFVCSIAGIRIPWIADVSLVSHIPTNITTMANATCDQCLCSAIISASAAVNCFLGDQTCQLFAHIPSSYILRPGSQVNLYFPQEILPSPSLCCMPNIDVLIPKLRNATMQSINVSKPREIVIDNHGYLVTVEIIGNTLSRFHANNLSRIDQTLLPMNGTISIAYHQEAYYIGANNHAILIMDSNSLTVINMITSVHINGPRGVIFLRDGQIMVVASTSDKQLVFFHQSNVTSKNYTYAYNVTTSYVNPHGLWFVNDSFFYATSWQSSSLYSHATTDGIAWTETLIVNPRNATNSTSTSHVLIDDCERKWLFTSNIGMVVYNHENVLLSNFTPTSTGIFDAAFVHNYVMFLSDRANSRLIRLDPQVEC